MMAVKRWIILSTIVTLIMSENENCEFKDKLGTGFTLDLNSILGQKISGTEVSIDYTFNYTFTACANEVLCEYNTTINYNAMMLQVNPADTNNGTSKPFCTVIADWDNGVTQPEYRDATESWYFLYSNGLSSGCVDADNQTYPRHLELEIYCGHHLENDEFIVLDMGETSLKCFYPLELMSGSACVGRK
eukprot:UN12417